MSGQATPEWEAKIRRPRPAIGDVAAYVASWVGPDPTLARMCLCQHNLAQRSYSRGPCSYQYACGCGRFTWADAPDGAR